MPRHPYAVVEPVDGTREVVVVSQHVTLDAAKGVAKWTKDGFIIHCTAQGPAVKRRTRLHFAEARTLKVDCVIPARETLPAAPATRRVDVMLAADEACNVCEVAYREHDGTESHRFEGSGRRAQPRRGAATA